ncbi:MULTISPECIES: ATP-binding cassette domain-containing protein [unclassified Acinetobacter]|uniref:ATP-binding cassette domain-containing protein n=1 Tax=unclassified Acinetobacter TaxID=196816 RepID=UPI00235E9632|nr:MULTISPECIES: ATP-binding cassette domain-containing protein [unclassified Acinetobacter]
MLQCAFEYQHADFRLQVELNMQQPMMGLVGASGSGKTTLLKNIVGLCRPTQGNIQFQQQVLFSTVHNINIPMHQRRIALIFQQALLFPHLNVRKNLCYAEKMLKPFERKFQFEQVVELLELTPLLQRRTSQLSGGEAQRVSIGRALLSSPHLLLLDEPLTGLDDALKKQLLVFLKRVKDQMRLPMIYVTHHLDEVEFLQAEVMELRNGKLINVGTHIN